MELYNPGLFISQPAVIYNSCLMRLHRLPGYHFFFAGAALDTACTDIMFDRLVEIKKNKLVGQVPTNKLHIVYVQIWGGGNISNKFILLFFLISTSPLNTTCVHAVRHNSMKVNFNCYMLFNLLIIVACSLLIKFLKIGEGVN